MKFIIDSNTILELINNHVSSVIEVKPGVAVNTSFLENGDVEITLTPVENINTPIKEVPKPLEDKKEEVKAEEPKKPTLPKKSPLGNNPLFKDSTKDEAVTEDEPPFEVEEKKEEGKKPFSFAKLGQPKND